MLHTHKNILKGIVLLLLLCSNTYAQDTIKVKESKRKIADSLKQTAINDEEVSVGYGTILKSRNTASIAVITKEDIELTVNATLSQAIQGRAAGLNTYQSPVPGGKSFTYIRGIGSINSGNEPLYVLDGMPITSDFLNTINPGDIEKVEILKDAASCAIYGARGANGVIVITTKR